MLFAPFLLFYLIIAVGFLAFLFFFIQLNLISYAFMVLGLPPRMALFALLASLVGSYVNLPLYTVSSGPVPAVATVSDDGVIYSIPYEYAGDDTKVAINIGGAVVPIAVAGYALTRMPQAILPSALATIVVAAVTHRFAHPRPGLGITLPIFIAPLTAVLVGLFLGRALREARTTHVIAYVAGVVGTLIGADLSNLGRVAGLGAPVVSIGGAGTFDGIFLTGILAVLLAGI